MLQSKSKKIETIEDARVCAKTILRSETYGVLAVLEPESGYPLTSRVGVASDFDGLPILLLSQLSIHTQALNDDTRCSLLLGEIGNGDPLSFPRLSLIGIAEKLTKKSEELEYLRTRYLMHQPNAKLYIDFTDFSFFRIHVERANLNAGFGQFFKLSGEEIIFQRDWISKLRILEEVITEKINQTFKKDVTEYVKNLGGDSSLNWKIISIDPEGFNLSADTEIVRVNFSQPIHRINNFEREFFDKIRGQFSQN